MGDDLALPERNCARTPMQWSTEPNGGFTKSDKPVAAGHQRRALRLRARERGATAPRSELDAQLDRAHHPHAQGSARRSAGAISRSSQTGDHAVLAIRYDWRNNSVLFVHNLDGTPREVRFDVGLPAEDAGLLVNLLSEDHSRADATAGTA